MKINIKSVYLNSIITLSSASIIVMFVKALSSPILTRIFTVEQLGVFGFMISVTQMFMGVINGRYDMSIVTEKDTKSINPLIKLAFLVSVFLSIITSMMLWVYLKYKGDYDQILLLVLFNFCVLISYGIINVLSAFSNRNKEYKILATENLVRGASQSIGSIVFGLLNTGVIGLFLSYIIGQVLGIANLISSVKNQLLEIWNVSQLDMLVVAKKYKKQPFFSAPALLANSFSYSSITIFLEALFGISVVGYYSITNQVLGIPLSVVSGNVSKVFFEEAAREYDKSGSYINAFKKTLSFLVLLGVPMVLIIMLFAPWAFGVVFGKEWVIGGTYARILAPFLGLRFIVSPLTPGLIVANKQKHELILQLTFLLASIIPLVLTSTQALSVNQFLLLTSISKSFVFLIYLFFILWFSKKRQSKNKS